MTDHSRTDPSAPDPIEGVAWPSERAKKAAQRSLKWGRRLDYLIPSFALESPISRFGYRLATVIAFTWGYLLSTGAVQKHGELLVFTGMPPWAFRRGGICIGACYLTRTATPGIKVIRHEQVHVRQWQRYGLLFPLLNLISGFNPLKNRFEIEAGLSDGNYLPAKSK